MSLPIIPPDANHYQRLHITPLQPELLNVYLGPTLLQQAKNISYHTVQTFPEVGYGYLDLPMAEATKLKKKLSGSILKGHKIRIEDAQPDKRKRASEDVDDGGADAGDHARKKTRRSKKAKVGDKILQGYELEDGRKVKRGWTETPAEKKQEKEAKKKSKDKSDRSSKDGKSKKKHKREASKYTNDPECLFRTTLQDGVTTSENTSDKKDKKERKTKGHAAVVHEFSRTKKHPSFLKSVGVGAEGKSTQEYVEGKGWVDIDGNVVEEESTAQREKRERKEKRRAKKAVEGAALTEHPSSKKPEIKSKVKRNAEKTVTPEQEAAQTDSEPSSSEPSSPEPSSDEKSSAEEAELDTDARKDTATPDDTPRSVHPLEALYKRPQLSPLDTTPKGPRDDTFAFFGGGDDSDIDHGEDTAPTTEPQTPFNEQDMEWRGLRSAAPTPDTAAIGKRFSFSVMDDISEDEDDAEPTIVVSPGTSHGLGIRSEAASKSKSEGEEKEESEFAKWFYENRGENNKTWRLRRREAMKMKRKRENRRLTRRIL